MTAIRNFAQEHKWVMVLFAVMLLMTMAVGVNAWTLSDASLHAGNNFHIHSWIKYDGTTWANGSQYELGHKALCLSGFGTYKFERIYEYARIVYSPHHRGPWTLQRYYTSGGWVSWGC